jgi:metallo-beta-lactamase class B
MRRPLFLIAALSAAPVATNAAVPPEWSQARAPFRIVGETWYVGTEGISVLLIRGNEGAVLVDAAVSDAVPVIRANLETIGVDPSEIKLIITSHAHYDHVGGLAQLKALTGARVVASAESAALLAAGGKGDLHFGDELAYDPVVVDATLQDGETITLGDIALTAHLTPGHTPGSTTWHWRQQVGERRIDLVYADSLTAPGYRLVDHPRRPGLIEEFRTSFERIRALPCDLLVTPHPQASGLFDRHAGADRREQGVAVQTGACRQYAERASISFERQVDAERAKLTENNGSPPRP